MSLIDLTAVHTITVQDPTVTVGNSFGKTYSFADQTSTKTCNFQFLTAAEIQKLESRGQVATAAAYFSTDPSITSRQRIKFGTRIFRVTGAFTEYNGAGVVTLFVCYCNEGLALKDA